MGGTSAEGAPTGREANSKRIAHGVLHWACGCHNIVLNRSAQRG
jgi:hypothetical protein